MPLPDVTGEMSDAAWLKACADGDQSAARALTAKYAPRAYSVAYRMLRDQAEAEDIAQETMLRLWRKAVDWDENGGAQLGTWIYRVTSNLCIDRLRRSREKTVDTLPEIAAPNTDPTRQIQAEDRARALEAALLTLPERQRLAIILRHLEDHTNPQIAEILATSVDAVESLLARGRRALAAHLSDRRDEFDLSNAVND